MQSKVIGELSVIDVLAHDVLKCDILPCVRSAQFDQSSNFFFSQSDIVSKANLIELASSDFALRQDVGRED